MSPNPTVDMTVAEKYKNFQKRAKYSTSADAESAEVLCG
jgi:hypothetical protein